jgi:murein DD-endopeptidase MepM/ murein hydrolase activator NlpD
MIVRMLMHRALLGRIGLALLLFTTAPVPAVAKPAQGGAPPAPAPGASPALPAKQQELVRIQRRLDAERERLDKTRHRERGVSTEVQRLDRRLDSTTARLNRLSTDLQRTRLRAEAAAAELARAEMALARRRTVLAGRLRDVNRYGRAGYLDVVLGASSFPEFITRARLVTAVVRADGRLIQSYTNERDRVASLRDDLQLQQRRLHTLVEENQERREQLSEQINAKRAALDAIVRERAAAEHAVKELEEDSAELEALIQRLQGGAGLRARWSLAAIAWPLRGSITSRFGFRRHPIFRLRQFHTGVDIAAARGSPVRAAFGGMVLYAGWFGGYGKLIVIDHGDGYSTLYGHLSAIDVAVGDQITRGQVVGRVGSTGYSTGPHLHFEIRHLGKPINPLP